jgi:tRNA U34 5-methylaminomethyl-2-thiouridine-forming methyltransferase MnmC
VPEPRRTADGSFSLWSETYGEGFHSAEGALAEARQKFVAPAELERFPPGRELVVVEVAVGTGTNTAALIEATAARGLALRWWGLEQDPEPLGLALADPGFRSQWAAPVLARLEQLGGSEAMLWGDARRRLGEVRAVAGGRCDLVLLDAFSPRRCPELWSLEFLTALAQLLSRGGRLLTYCSAAAVRRALQKAGLELAAINTAAVRPHGVRPQGASPWSGGTVASPGPLPPSRWLRPLSPMEWEHLASRAGEPYRDPSGSGSAAAILAARAQAQAASGAESASRWQRRWGVERRRGPAGTPLGGTARGR